jgi:acyl-CoA synthetase (AMP-forming)/AMP-acid ligase II
MRFVNPDTGRDAKVRPDGSTEPGELWISGPQVMKGYLKNDLANRSAFSFEADGTRWYRTGDVGYVDRHGYVTLSDRIKEMIKYKGIQVIPSDMEGKLVEHPDIEDAGVVGTWVEDQATEVPVAFVVLRSGVRKTEQTVSNIHQWVNANVSNPKRLRGGIRIVDAIPKSASGKILRRQLRDLLKQPRTSSL